MIHIKEVEVERYTESELERLAESVYAETVPVLGMTFDALRIIKELDEVYYAQLLDDLQEYVTKYECTCGEQYDDEEEVLECLKEHH